jgi:hypothetical protein
MGDPYNPTSRLQMRIKQVNILESTKGRQYADCSCVAPSLGYLKVKVYPSADFDADRLLSVTGGKLDIR